MLVLLVIFILTAPLLAKAIQVNLPQTVKAPTADAAALNEKLINEPELVLRLKSDASVPYEQAAQLVPESRSH